MIGLSKCNSVIVFYVLSVKMVTTCASYGCSNRAKRGSKVKLHKFCSIKRADLGQKGILAMKGKEFMKSATA